ncbi:adenylate/guanylate cyclase domain-containing protein [Kitasatospora camelliae]|uniref:Adenylate/guanylate cyclase domain-containing protein n=1 Tax=Kitasatospora camelliae TaxID=3156397 RepID=A0AAU8K1I3_9ACTN
MNCSSCRSALPPDARFCPSCGAPCAPAGPAAAVEGRKVVTVLFCDLVGSTALSGRLDPETLRSVTLRYFELMRQQIEAHGGTLEKFIGDAVMAVFGVPAVREDDARRAVAAALGMVGALERLNTELDAALGVRLTVRIGVNTGRVVTGSDSSARQALVSGEVVNVAARLEQNAGPGEILIGPDTRLAGGPAVRVEEVGPLHLKGKAEPVTAYRLLGLGDDAPELLRRFDVRFVGRDAELAELDAALERAVTGGTQRLLVHGEAGQGKTRLVREWLDRAAARTAVHGAGRCRPYGDQGSLRPLADAVAPLLGHRQAGGGPADPEVLCDLLGVIDPDERAALAEALAVLAAGLLLDGTPDPSLEDTCAALVRVLTAVARRRPVVLVVDDCHWAGPVLLEVLDRLARDLGPAPVLMLGLARPEILDGTPPGGRQLLLSGLSDRESAVLAAELVEVGTHGELPESLLERSGGNPLHLEQLLATVSETGSRDELPPTVQALLGARIDALGAAERLALDLGAVVGREFDADELAVLAADRGGSVPAALLGLSRRRLVEPGPGGGGLPFRFTSGLVQEITYQSMSKRSRAERHERAAQLPSVRAAGAGAVGGHLERAHRLRSELGLLDEGTERLRTAAAEALTRAGGQALARADLSWAEDLLTRALALHPPAAHTPTGLGAARRLGEVKLALGRTAEGRALLAEVAAGAADPVEAAHARLALAGPGRAGEAEPPAAAARALLPVFEAAADDLGQARACLRLAQDHQVQGRHGEADRFLVRALSHAVRADGEAERAAALGAMGVSLWRGPEPVPQAVARCRTLLAEHGRRRRTVRVTLNCPLAILLALHGQPDAARDRLAEAGRLARELGYAEARVFLPVFAATVETLAGHRPRAIEELDAAAAAARELGAGALLGTVALESARLLLDAEEWSAARHALAPAEAGGARPHAETVDLDGLRARLAAADGDAGRALRLADQAVAAAERTDSPVLQGNAALDRAHVLRLLGRPAEAATAAAVARARFTAKGHLPGVGWTDRFLPAAGQDRAPYPHREEQPS